jgi:hypothetical protein
MNPKRTGKLMLSLFTISLAIVAIVVAGTVLFPQGPHESYLKSMAATSSNLVSKKIGPNSAVRIAFIKPTFTHAAYTNSFYVFYARHSHESWGNNVTSDLSFLSTKVDSTEMQSQYPLLSLVDNVRKVLPNSKIQTLTDGDVDVGAIFGKQQLSNNENNSISINAFDVLILGHQEYVTQKEYDNLKQFVKNGGTIIFLDGNAFFAEVKYDRANSVITLVKGHWWEFDGKVARVSVGERWQNETSQWVGSNYFCYLCTITFANNPFGYRHHEEQYLTNPSDVILLNYRASDPSHIVATYELQYGKGRSVVIGLYSDDIIHNERFIRFFDGLLLRHLQ